MEYRLGHTGEKDYYVRVSDIRMMLMKVGVIQYSHSRRG